MKTFGSLMLLLILVCLHQVSAFAQWVRTVGPYGGPYIACLAVSPASGGTNLFAGTNAGVFLSTDNGTSWTAVNTGLTNTTVNALAVRGTTLFAGTDEGVFLSSNSGKGWTAVDEGLPRSFFDTTKYSALHCFATSGQNLFAGTDGGVCRSTNNGTSWTLANSGLGNFVSAFAVDGTYLFAATPDGSVFVFMGDSRLSPSWVTTGPSGGSVGALVVMGTNLIAGTFGGGIFLSDNGGVSWAAVNMGLPPRTWIRAFAVSGTNLFAGTHPGGVLLSTDGGTSWSQVSGYFPYTDITALVVSGTYLIAGTDGSGVWRRPLSEMVTGVKDVAGNTIPDRFVLEQNYPNPFNPSTTIRYGLPHQSNVSLVVYNTIGQQVTTLVEEEQKTGYHEVRFDGSNVASGVYFYRLSVSPPASRDLVTQARDGQAGTFVEVKKFALVR